MITSGERALCHYFARFHDDHESSDEWQSHVWATLLAECGSPKESDSGPFWADKGVYVFQFGAYGCTHVVSTGSLEDALESAAEVLPKGYFVEPEPELEGIDPDDENAIDRAWHEATEDLTYTESGYLASWEWRVCEIESPSALVAYFSNVSR
jgi:hypothetical protein